MKKLALAFVLILGLSIGAFAQNGGLFGYGESEQEESYNIAWYSFYQDQDEIDNGLFGLFRDDPNIPGLPGHGQSGNQPATPLGSGALLLIGFGAAYALKKRNSKR